MIESVIIKDINKVPIKYMVDIPIFLTKKKFEFKEGINIIIGPNGCGKSTLLKLISKYLLCENTNKSELSLMGSDFPNNLFEQSVYLDSLDKTKFNDGVDIKCDFSIVSFNLRNPKEMNNREALSSFDSFCSVYQGAKSSMGENMLIALNSLFELAFNKNTKLEFPMIELKRKIDFVNEIWKENIKNLLNYYKKNHIKTEQKIFTFLLDEPDRNLDISNIESVYTILSHERKDTQLIAVVHNPILIYKLSKLNYVNFIELKKGYLNKIKKVIEGL